MKVNIDQLRSFVTVVESGGIHRAVARLHLSQPAASRQINALEAALGVPLFDRIGRRLKLTSEGEGLLRLSRRLLGEVEVFHERAIAFKRGKPGYSEWPLPLWSLKIPFRISSAAIGANIRAWRFS